MFVFLQDDGDSGRLKVLMPGVNLQNVTAAIGFLTQHTTDQLANVTIMCDGQNCAAECS